MNITELENDCKSRARIVFENFKDTLLNHPFIETKINQGIIDDCINFQVKQVYGRKLLKNYIDQAKSPEQMKYLNERIAYYKEILIKTCVAFGEKQLKSQPNT